MRRGIRPSIVTHIEIRSRGTKLNASQQVARSSFDRNSPIVRALRRTEIFIGLESPEILEEVAGAAMWFQAARRREVLPDRDDLVVVVASGSARVFTRVGDRQLTLSYVDAGSLLFEERIMPVAGRVARHAVALENIEGVAIPSSLINELAHRSPRLASSLLRYSQEIATVCERRLVSLLSRSVEARLSEFILDMAAAYGVPDSRGVLISQRFTHLDIANYIGSTRETVTLVLGEFKRSGIIEFDSRRLVIRDRDRLYRKALE